MKSDIIVESAKMSLEKAAQLGKVLSRGGTALPDSQPAFQKKCKK